MHVGKQFCNTTHNPLSFVYFAGPNSSSEGKVCYYTVCLPQCLEIGNNTSQEVAPSLWATMIHSRIQQTDCQDKVVKHNGML